MYVRQCPRCDDRIEYKSKLGFKNATKANTNCRRCRSIDPSFKKKCSEGTKRAYADPNSLFNDPGNSDRRSAARKRSHADPNSALGTPDWKEKIRIGTHRAWGTDPDNPVSDDPGVQAWASRVKKRDGFTCQCCGSTSNLHAHHIRLKSKYPAFMLVDNNGVTLCEICHYKVHHKPECEVQEPFLCELREKLESVECT